MAATPEFGTRGRHPRVFGLCTYNARPAGSMEFARGMKAKAAQLLGFPGVSRRRPSARLLRKGRGCACRAMLGSVFGRPAYLKVLRGKSAPHPGARDAAVLCGGAQLDSNVDASGPEPGAGASIRARAVAPGGHARAPAAGPDRGRRGGADPAVRQHRAGAAEHGGVGLPRPVARGHARRWRRGAAPGCRAAARAAGGGVRGQAVAPAADRWRHRAGGRRRRRQDAGGRPVEGAGHDLRGGHPRPAAGQYQGPIEADVQANDAGRGAGPSR